MAVSLLSRKFAPDSAPPPLTNLLTDTTTRTQVSSGRPAYLVPRVDPIFGPTVTRVSRDPGQAMLNNPSRTWGSLLRIVYPRFQAWNADETLLYLTQNEGGGGSGGGTWLDGETYEDVYSRSYPSGWVEGRWHDIDPRQMIYCTSTQLRRLYIGPGTPADNTTALINDFSPTYSSITLGLFEGEQSRDSDVWPITAIRASDGAQVVFAYKISTDQILSVVRPGLFKTYGDGGNQISPDGTMMSIWFDDETFRTYRLSDGVLLFTSTVLQRPSHYAMARDNDGTQVVVGGDRSVSGHMAKVSLVAESFTTLNPNSFTYHSSAANHDWNNADTFVLGDYWQDSGLPYVNELVISAMDASVRGRICHMHKGTFIAYSNEIHATMSRTGKRIVYKTTWEQATETPVGVYVVDWRDFQLPGVG